MGPDLVPVQWKWRGRSHIKQPTVFYRRQIEQKRPTNHSADQERITYLQKKIQTKDEVLAELMAEHVAPKKDIGARQGTSPGRAAPDRLRQRAAVHCQRLQGIHSGLGHDPCHYFALLSSMERKNRTYKSLKESARAGNAAVPGGCEAASVSAIVFMRESYCFLLT
jgi:hypothetical protein